MHARTPNRHILFLVSSMQGGGAERVAALLCNHWVRTGWRVTLMPTFSGRGTCLYPLDQRVQLDFLADRVEGTVRTLGNRLRRFVALRRAIRDLSPDVVVAFLTQVNVVALLASRGLSVPVVVSERSYPPHNPLGPILRALRRVTYRWAKTVVVQTEGIADWVKDHCPKVEVAVIPNPVVLPVGEVGPRRYPLDYPSKGRRLLLAVGRLEEEKGFDILIKAFANLATGHPRWDLVILGNGAKKGELQQQSDALGLHERVIMPGRVGNLSEWYEAADLFVLSSRYEGFPNTLLEAMAHGVPVVSFDCRTGPGDIIVPEVDGVLVDPGRGADGLAQALSRLMRDEALRRRMGKEARDVGRRYSIDSVGASWLAVLGFV